MKHLEIHKLPYLTQEEVENLNRFITNKEIELVIKHLTMKKIQEQIDSLVNFGKYIKRN